MTSPDTIDTARAVAQVRYMEALHSGDEAKRKAALAEYTRLHHQKIDRIMPRAVMAEPDEE